MPLPLKSFEEQHERFNKHLKETKNYRVLNTGAYFLLREAKTPEQVMLADLAIADWCIRDGYYGRAIMHLACALKYATVPLTRAEIYYNMARCRFSNGQNPAALNALKMCFKYLGTADGRPQLEHDARRLQSEVQWHIAHPSPSLWDRLVRRIQIANQNISGGYEEAMMRGGSLSTW